MEFLLIFILLQMLVCGGWYFFYRIKKNNLLLEIYKMNAIKENYENNLLQAKQDSEQQQLNLEKSNDTIKLLEQENNRLQIQYSELKSRTDEWHKLQEKTAEYAKAAVFEVGGKLSAQLIEQHKKESEQYSKKIEEQFKETKGSFHSQFENIVKSVSILNQKINDSSKNVDVVKQALLSPAGAGNLAEITLENILKSSGLIKDTDYMMQYSFIEEETSLRPDSVVFLPGDNLMVIDSKASKFFLELSENENPETIEKFIISMNTHLKSLISKNYIRKFRDYLLGKEIVTSVNHISMVMFLPAENVLEKIKKYDPKFLNTAWNHNIYPAGPIGLMNILSHAKFQISQNNQIENHKHIIEEVSMLMSNLGTLYEHARKVSNSLQSASSNFDKFAATFNSKIYAKAQKLITMGISLKNQKTIDAPLKRFQIISSDKVTMLEVETEQEVNLKLQKD